MKRYIHIALFFFVFSSTRAQEIELIATRSGNWTTWEVWQYNYEILDSGTIREFYLAFPDDSSRQIHRYRLGSDDELESVYTSDLHDSISFPLRDISCRSLIDSSGKAWYSSYPGFDDFGEPYETEFIPGIGTGRWIIDSNDYYVLFVTYDDSSGYYCYAIPDSVGIYIANSESQIPELSVKGNPHGTFVRWNDIEERLIMQFEYPDRGEFSEIDTIRFPDAYEPSVMTLSLDGDVTGIVPDTSGRYALVYFYYDEPEEIDTLYTFESEQIPTQLADLCFDDNYQNGFAWASSGENSSLYWNYARNDLNVFSTQYDEVNRLRFCQSEYVGHNPWGYPNDWYETIWLVWSEYNAEVDSTKLYVSPVYHDEYITAVEKESLGISLNNFVLDSVYPNPFNSAVKISGKIASPGIIRFSLFDVLGRCVTENQIIKQVPGTFSWQWDAGNATSGTYMLRVENKGMALSRQIRLVK
ncbi:T9SS type A sorting domain-containing protein [Calditrichota bacterium]